MPDAVTYWNDVLLDVIRAEGGPPGPISRGGAMMHGAIYDAVNSIVPTHEPYLVSVPAAHGASIEAAVAYAAHDALAAAFPSTTVDLADALAAALAGVVPQSSVSAGKAVGRTCAAAMIDHRRDDGADDQTHYVPGSKPGDWRPTRPGAGAATPHWPKVKPFCMSSGTQFRPPRPGGFLSKTEMLASAEYAAQFNEVKELGEAASTTRTAEQTQIAKFWANDLDGTYKPPGQLFAITQIVADARALDVVENARLFALVALALGDAGICAWDAKYATDLDLWRPETAIRMADQDGNAGTAADAAWEPLSQDGADHFSPPFPAYVSGHATFAAAHAAIMRLYFGTDNVTFTATSEDPNLPAGVTRTFNSFTEAARENSRSRVYLGVHFQWDGDHGYHAGTALGEHIFATRLRPRAADYAGATPKLAA
ncbi:MAG TPA: vanadium-dependent haloperoxidase [Solirubrobacteraceae bacterium]|nr:vanadium-dependent haloperoxidase [Solirubrobacteraceae bacterium]